MELNYNLIIETQVENPQIFQEINKLKTGNQENLKENKISFIGNANKINKPIAKLIKRRYSQSLIRHE